MSTDERTQMLEEIRALRERVTALETKTAAETKTAPETMPPQAQYTPATPRPQRTGDHNLELYGFVQLDAIQDFDRVNPDWEATLRPSRIPTQKGQFGSDGQTIFSRPPVAARGEGQRQACR